MKRLILMRHAKSSWADAGQADIDRPLNGRGRRNAAAIGGWLRDQGYRPDEALVSSATRTRETWFEIAAVLGQGPARFLPELYEADPERMLGVLREAHGAGVLMIGHQPGIGSLARRLLADVPDDPEFAHYPTAATAVIDFDVEDWGAVAWNAGRLVAFVVPRAL
ncbi:histidine phosphatase family protein [Amaricoccus sp.]|uniref:SixA phosphatase family protein n=1 Tax=Amaricoccus sp. TaxID=1872485 RepID=UPI002614F919|nr:histidine phosphatase family protein [uncultured Amaricoccus sp.]